MHMRRQMGGRQEAPAVTTPGGRICPLPSVPHGFRDTLEERENVVLGQAAQVPSEVGAAPKRHALRGVPMHANAVRKHMQARGRRSKARAG